MGGVMTVISPPPVIRGSAPAAEPFPSTMARKWSVLQDAANVVAALAGLPGGSGDAAVADYPAAMRAVGGWRLALAAQGVNDLAAVMEHGLAALLSLHGRDADPTVPAQALWEEFEAARSALLILAVGPPQR
jgi:hypothetical protein